MNVSCTLATYARLPDLDPDDRLFFDALIASGVNCSIACWDDKNYRWDKTQHVILRSTWDYHLNLSGFLSWIDRIAPVTTVWNCPELIKWNVMKTYLLRLAEDGVPVVPTKLLPHGLEFDLQRLLEETGWDKAVIKPVVGLATHGVHVVSRENIHEGQRALDRLLAEDDVLFQMYMDSVNEPGERSLIFIGGELTHAVRKSAFQAMATAGNAGERQATASSDEVAVARQALSCLPQSPLYARVDLVRDQSGQPVIMELELVEPSLFLSFAPAAAGKFASTFLDQVAALHA